MSSITIIDIEASGLHIDSYPIEVAILLNGKLYSWLIKPEYSWKYWSKTAENMHGISKEELLQKGLPARQVADELNNTLGATNGLLYSDASEWDAGWLRKLYEDVGAIPYFYILPIQDLFSTDDEEKLFYENKKQILITGKYRQHRAGEDVQLINEAIAMINESDKLR